MEKYLPIIEAALPVVSQLFELVVLAIRVKKESLPVEEVDAEIARILKTEHDEDQEEYDAAGVTPPGV